MKGSRAVRVAGLPRRLLVVRGAAVGLVGWVGESLRRGRVGPVTAQRGALPCKPGSGGLWCSPVWWSPWGPMTDWARRLARLDSTVDTLPLALLRARASARVLVLRRPADVTALARALPVAPAPLERALIDQPAGLWPADPAIDWPALARLVDAVWLPPAAVSALTRPGRPLYLWDVPTVLFTHPRAFYVVGRRNAPARAVVADEEAHADAVWAEVTRLIEAGRVGQEANSGP